MTNEITIDVPRLRKELEYITANRAQWLQGAWLRRTACGTVGCLAGNTALNAGYLPVIAPGLDGTGFVSLERITVTSDADFDLDEALATGRVRTVRDVARELLGLGPGQAVTLFDNGHWSLYELWSIASDFTDGEIEIPADVVAEHESGQRASDGYTVVARNEDAGLALRRAHRERQRQLLAQRRAEELGAWL